MLSDYLNNSVFNLIIYSIKFIGKLILLEKKVKEN